MLAPYFGLRTEPFELRADPELFCPTRPFEEASLAVGAAIASGHRLTFLAGEAGVGKTTLLRRLSAQLEADGSRVFSLTCSNAATFDLLQACCDRAGLAHGARDDATRSRALIEHLAGSGDNRPTVIVVDEAENLDADALAVADALLREQNSNVRVSLVLAGLLEFESRVRAEGLLSLRYPHVTCRLQRLLAEEVSSFVTHQLCSAGYDGKALFSGAALERICRDSRGVPALINRLCGAALLLTSLESAWEVSVATVEQAAEDCLLRLSPSATEAKGTANQVARDEPCKVPEARFPPAEYRAEPTDLDDETVPLPCVPASLLTASAPGESPSCSAVAGAGRREGWYGREQRLGPERAANPVPESGERASGVSRDRILLAPPVAQGRDPRNRSLWFSIPPAFLLVVLTLGVGLGMGPSKFQSSQRIANALSEALSRGLLAFNRQDASETRDETAGERKAEGAAPVDSVQSSGLLAKAATHSHLGLVLFRRGDLAQAQHQYREALRIYESLDRKLDIGRECNNLGLVYWAGGDLHEAEVLYRRSLDIHLRLGVPARVADNHANLGSVYWHRGELAEAEAMYRRALSINKALDRKEQVANAYSNLGLVHYGRGELVAAKGLYRQALSIYAALGANSRGAANTYRNLGSLYAEQGDLDQAELLYRKAMALYERLRQSSPQNESGDQAEKLVLRSPSDLRGMRRRGPMGAHADMPPVGELGS
jgi:type II secretory pathway predicted ATPase ExeA/tetratricopeptide (TPR) repeat protein